MSIAGILPYIQIVLSILLMGGILLQQSEAGLGGAFGGGDGFSSGQHSKRGAEKVIFIATIVLAVLFAVSSFIILLI
jgi:protein translocase SecG subunit